MSDRRPWIASVLVGLTLGLLSGLSFQTSVRFGQAAPAQGVDLDRAGWELQVRRELLDLRGRAATCERRDVLLWSALEHVARTHPGIARLPRIYSAGALEAASLALPPEVMAQWRAALKREELKK